MIAALVLAIQVSGPIPPITPPPATPAAGIPPVADWPALPLYPLPRPIVLADATNYVRTEVEAGRCHPVVSAQGDDAHVVAPVAILVGLGGNIRRIVPQAIDCPTVEQFTVGYLLSVTRVGSDAAIRPVPGWYRLTMTYRW
jgi:hypothetical protein